MMNENEIAEACARVMWAADAASRELGMRIESIAPGSARVSMAVRDDMVNGHQTCHGGYIFTLADSAFAFACNSFNRRAVAQNCSIVFLKPGAAGDRLIATANQRSQAGRNGVYDVRVANQDDDTIAEFRGCSRDIAGLHIAQTDDS